MSAETAEHTARGELRWNIKQSFRDYVGELPDGEETWTGTVGGIDGRDLVFPVAEVGVDLDAPVSGTLKFGGAVRYDGYRGMLRVDLSDPWLEFGADEVTTLSANIAPTGLAERRTVIATVVGLPVTSGNDGWEWTADATALSAGGAAVLGSVYPPGTEADGFSLRVTRA